MTRRRRLLRSLRATAATPPPSDSPSDRILDLADRTLSLAPIQADPAGLVGIPVDDFDAAGMRVSVPIAEVLEYGGCVRYWDVLTNASGKDIRRIRWGDERETGDPVGMTTDAGEVVTTIVERGDLVAQWQVRLETGRLVWVDAPAPDDVN